MMSNLRQYFDDYGQSPWVDNIRRDWLDDGTLARLVESGVRGVTSNPAIFAKSFATSSAYDAAVREVGSSDPEVVFESLAVRDVRDACDVLLSVFVSSRDNGRYRDGFVSLEVSPRLAHETQATIDAAVRLFGEVDRENVMIKIPATRAGLAAIRTVIGLGINVNVTLIFSLDRYREVLEAWTSGLEDARDAGRSLSNIGSVASFFVSRVDTAFDQLLDAQSPLRGRVALAQVAAAYEIYLEWVSSPRVRELVAGGAQVQRPLWASTSVKNPAYDELLYVDSLVAPETVNTMPDATLEAASDHGQPATSLITDDHSRRSLAALLEEIPSNVTLREVTQKLEDDGVAAFATAYDELLATVAAKLNSPTH
ncbi:MAG: transaldolase [Acidobacteria bacterium]|nr:transaldolase [Acidobacteriota bacterium]